MIVSDTIKSATESTESTSSTSSTLKIIKPHEDDLEFTVVSLQMLKHRLKNTSPLNGITEQLIHLMKEVNNPRIDNYSRQIIAWEGVCLVSAFCRLIDCLEVPEDLVDTDDSNPDAPAPMSSAELKERYIDHLTTIYDTFFQQHKQLVRMNYPVVKEWDGVEEVEIDVGPFLQEVLTKLDKNNTTTNEEIEEIEDSEENSEEPAGEVEEVVETE